MANVIKNIKIRDANGNVGAAIPIAVNASNVYYSNNKTVQELYASVVDISEIAQTFVQSDSYSKGDYVYYPNDRKIYKLQADHPSGRTWAQTSKQEVVLANQLKAIYDNGGGNVTVDVSGLVAFDDIAPQFNSNDIYTKGQYVYYNGDFYRFKARHDAGVSWQDSASLREKKSLTLHIQQSIGEIYNNIDAIVKVSRTQPTEELNKLWIDDTADEGIQLPTFAEFTNLKNTVKEIVINTDNNELQLRTII